MDHLNNFDSELSAVLTPEIYPETDKKSFWKQFYENILKDIN